MVVAPRRGVAAPRRRVPLTVLATRRDREYPPRIVITVIFACVHNAGRSQMAAAFFNQLVDPTKARGISAGTQPGARVHPEVLATLREVGIDLEGVIPQKLTPELVNECRWLITMGCGDECPIAPPFVQKRDWPLEDPKGKPIERVREIRDDVRARIAGFVAENGWGSV